MITLEKIEIDKNCTIEVGQKKMAYEELVEKIEKISSNIENINEPVALFFKHNESYIIAALAAIKAGITFIPINTEDPVDRINYILKKCEVSTILSCKECVSVAIAKLKGHRVTYIEDILGTPYIARKIRNKVYAPQDTMYILFTSGSTGEPKGVEVTRDNFVSFAQGIFNSIEFERNDTILFHTNITFDISLLETVAALCVGLRVVVMNENECNNVRLMKKVILEKDITVLQITPSKLQLLLNENRGFVFLKNIKKCLIGGESLSVGLYSKLLKIKHEEMLDFKVYNVYGPTETTIWSTVSEMTNKAIITIGQPICTAEIYILDEQRNIIADIGQEGEIFITGKIVAKGYVNDSVLTNEKFVEIKDFEQNSRRGFLTGDLGEWNQEGQLIYRGRKDNMVKVNGYRIELEEIEAVISNITGTVGKYIVAKWEYNNSNSLVVFYNQKETDISHLKERLKEKLPTYMVPAIFCFVNQFPYTTSFKVDRNKLLLFLNEKNKVASYMNEKDVGDVSEEINLLNIIKKNLPDSNVEISDETRLEELGINSITFIKIIVAIEDEYEMEFEDSKLRVDAFQNYNNLKKYVMDKRRRNE